MSYTFADVIAVLRLARQRIETGWVRGTLIDQGRYCLIGACGVRPVQEDEFSATQEAIRLLCEGLRPDSRPWERGSYAGGLTGFNDDPATTVEAVLAVLDRAVELAEVRNRLQEGTR